MGAGCGGGGAAEERAGRRGLFSHQHGQHNESDGAEGPNCTLLLFSDVGLFLFGSLNPFEDLVTFERNRSIPVVFFILFSLGLCCFFFFFNRFENSPALHRGMEVGGGRGRQTCT